MKTGCFVGKWGDGAFGLEPIIAISERKKRFGDAIANDEAISYAKLKKLSDESGISMSKLMLLATLKEYKLIDDKNSEPLAQESNLVASLRRARSASHRQGKNPKEVEPLH